MPTQTATITADRPDAGDLAKVLESKTTGSGINLATLSLVSPVLVVFLRHAGCTFCREALADLSESRRAVEASGARIVVVHLGNRPAMEDQLQRYGLSDLDRIFDADQSLYRAFGLRRGRPGQLYGPKIWWRGVYAGLLKKCGFGKPAGDVRQMPGLFLLNRCRVVRSFRHRSAADRPLYDAFVKVGLEREHLLGESAE